MNAATLSTILAHGIGTAEDYARDAAIAAARAEFEAAIDALPSVREVRRLRRAGVDVPHELRARVNAESRDAEAVLDAKLAALGARL